MKQITLANALKASPIVAIVRGVAPDEAKLVAEAVFRGGVRIIEVPLNSPDPFVSIKEIAGYADGKMIVGAGTVLTESQLDCVAAAGGQIAVAPNVNPLVIRRAIEYGLTPLPGVMTPTEMFQAVDAGATKLKLFPAGALGASGLKAMLAVAPPEVEVFAVGGVGASNAAEWLRAGAVGLGIGSELYKPGDDPNTIYSNTRKIVDAIK